MVAFILASLFLLLSPTNAFCLPTDIRDREASYLAALKHPCSRFRLPPSLVLAIIRQESFGNPLVINLQGKDLYPKTEEEAITMAENFLAKGKSFDVGLMQINSCWIREYKIPVRLLFRIKNNLFFGCFILAKSVAQSGQRLTWKAVGHYHSHTPWRRDDYISRIQAHLSDILKGK